MTISALIAGGQAEQLPFHLNRGMDKGLTQIEISEVITHLALLFGLAKGDVRHTGREDGLRGAGPAR